MPRHPLDPPQGKITLVIEHPDLSTREQYRWTAPGDPVKTVSLKIGDLEAEAHQSSPAELNWSLEGSIIRIDLEFYSGHITFDKIAALLGLERI